MEGEDGSLIDPPYPAETKAKGWRFDLDYEQIEQSSTWALAGAEAKPWLLMLWFTAWKQSPCGTLPADEQVVAAMIGMSSKAWSKHRSVLMRGWVTATDGRMYHPTLTARVHEMMSKRRRESDRKALQRAGTPKDNQGSPKVVPGMSHGTDAGLPQDSTGNPTPTPTPTEKQKNPPTPRKRGECEPDGFAEFYAAYPRHVARADAAKAFRKQGLTASDLPSLLAAVEAQRGSRDWLEDGGKYIPYPASWLNDRRWTDEVTTTVVPLRRLAF